MNELEKRKMIVEEIKRLTVNAKSNVMYSFQNEFKGKIDLYMALGLFFDLEFGAGRGWFSEDGEITEIGLRYLENIRR